MHIAIDSTPLTGGHEDRGVGVYTKKLIESLQQYGTTHSYSFFTRTQKVDKNADLVHYPYFDPFFLTLPLLKQKPTIVTVHDLIPLVFPDKFPSGFRGSFKWQVQKLALKGVERIVTDSQSSKKDIQRFVGLDADAIDVVYLAPSLPSLQKAENLNVLKEKYGIRGPFILSVGDVNWNKNVAGLLKAFARVSGDPEFKDVSLVVVGKAFLNKSLPEVIEINRLIDSLNLNGRIIQAGYVPDGDLACMYSMAVCLVQCSYYEGFGLPVLEAMVRGCPVVVSDNSSLSEIAGPSLRVKAENTEEIADGMKAMLIIPEGKRKKIVQDGFAWVQAFSWQKVAAETIASYEKVVSGI